MGLRAAVSVALNMASSTLQGRGWLKNMPERFGTGLTVGGKVVEATPRALSGLELKAPARDVKVQRLERQLTPFGAFSPGRSRLRECGRRAWRLAGLSSALAFPLDLGATREAP